MGVQGLLPLLKSIQRPTELKKHAGQTLAVDAYGWLHRGAIACAIELAQGKPTQKYITYCLRRVKMMQHFGVTPYLVFDGGYLPSKSDEEAHRRKRRQESRQAGMELLKAGKPSLAHKELQKAVDISPEMARNLIEELKKLGLPYVVAPYEADPQMVYLERQGLVDGILSEDSDLLVFGAKRLFTKLDDYGQCIEINRRDFSACRDLHMADWTDAQFRHMAIFRGCDYLSGIEGLGLKTAYRMLRKFKTPEKVISRILLEGKLREQVFLTPLPEDLNIEDMPYIGADVEASVAKGMATGDINPITKQNIIVVPPSPGSKKRRASSSAQASLPAPTPKKPIDSYFKKDGRIPLGNMDPNCFIPDPDRVADMTENGQRPIIFPLPRPYVDEQSAPATTTARPYTNRRHDSSASRNLRRRTEPISSLLIDAGTNLGSTSRRQTAGPTRQPSGPGPQSSGNVSARPPKKARLCDDALLASLPGQETSKFFPTGKKRTSMRKSEGYLMSDDSIEDVLRDLPEMDGWERSQKGSQIFVFEEQSQQSTNSNSRDDIEVVESASAYEAEASETPLQPAISQFAFHATSASASSSSQGRRTSYARPTPSSSARSWSAESTPGSLTSSVGAASTAMSTPATPFMTPLQRLGARAMKGVTQPATPTFAVPQALKKRSSAGRRSLDNLPVNPAFVPLPRMDLAEVEALHKTEGSEDMIVPESENEDEGQENMGKRTDQPRKIDLSRFLFA
ncbi:PIN domain-like protein [Truncatella angustata]|uniref:PIN domain-like protein n=1 Tax=Truncatella angustata TaxID=152316 RepID=A0A9P8ZXQ5_9PEZI|nr:PIN domain-like protein [Truncatella angustata]KAH6653209.1 PIN domain-like protein [Truncatella angustata]